MPSPPTSLNLTVTSFFRRMLKTNKQKQLKIDEGKYLRIRYFISSFKISLCHLNVLMLYILVAKCVLFSES